MRVGPRMEEAAEYVREHPGCPILPVAEHVGPHGSRRYGYATVHRAIRAGLIWATEGKGGRYALYPVDAVPIGVLGADHYNPEDDDA